jgi:signal transduction histidine kinase
MMRSIPRTDASVAPHEECMRSDRRDEYRARRELRRARHRSRSAWDAPDQAPADRNESEEERALREARQAANRRIGFLSHLLSYFLTCTFLLFVAGFRPALIVALGWGIGIGAHYFGAILAPRMRAEIIEREMRRRRDDVSRTRRTLEGEHTRRIEELSASLAHEIRNPITATRSLVQQMGEDPTAHENVEYAKVALQELERVERSISHLLRYAREEDLELAPVDLASVVTSAIDTFRDRLREQGVAVEVDLARAGRVRGDAEQLRRVVINLVANALDAFAEARTAAPRLRVQGGENLAGTEVWLRVRDNGPGIEPERLARVFSPFYTSKRNGTGLGLALAKKTLEAHGGQIEAHSTPGSGTEFVVTLPKLAAPEEHSA